MPATPPGSIGAWSSSYLTKFLNDWLRRNPLPAQDQLTIKKLAVSDKATAPTPSAGDNSTQVATTAFVQSSSPVTSVFGRSGAVVAASGDYTAAQVTNAADTASASAQVFTGALAVNSALPTFPTTTTFFEASGNGQFFAGAPAAGNSTLHTYVANGTNTGWSFYIAADGSHFWGPGDSTADIKLIRNGVRELRVSAITASPSYLSVGNGTQTGYLIDAGAGLVIGSLATQKIGFFGTLGVVQPSAVGAATGYTAGTTAATFHSDDKYTGNVGTTAYTINGIVAALKNLGLIHT